MSETEGVVSVWKVQLADRYGKQGGNVVHESIVEALAWVNYLMQTAEEEENQNVTITLTCGTMSRKALDELGEFQGF